MDDIKSLLTQILRSEFENELAFVGLVTDVQGTLCIVESLEGKGIYHNIRLQANPNNGVLMIPKEGSHVIVGRMTGGGGYIAMTSSVDSIQLLDGSYGGLVKVDELVEKLNVLERHVHATQGGPPLDGATPILPTTSPELENPDITHGAP